MVRGHLANSIPDLQLEWATKHSTSSIRNFLIKVKGLTERQYRYLMTKADQNSWHRKRREVEIKIQDSHVETYVDKVFRITDAQHKAAQATLLKITNKILKLDADKCQSVEILNLTRALATAQEVSFKALGISDESLRRVFAEKENHIGGLKPINPTSVDESEKINRAVERLDYDDIVDLIKARRRKQREIAATLQRVEAEDKP